MRSWIDRLMKCGIPEDTAEQVVSFLFKRRRTLELIAFVRLAEEATKR